MKGGWRKDKSAAHFPQTLKKNTANHSKTDTDFQTDYINLFMVWTTAMAKKPN